MTAFLQDETKSPVSLGLSSSKLRTKERATVSSPRSTPKESTKVSPNGNTTVKGSRGPEAQSKRADKNDSWVRQRPVQAARPPFHFALRPRDISQHLDRFVICQDEAKKVLAVALCDHFQHVRMTLEGQPAPFYVKQNVLLLGPTGVGKTHLIRSAAELIGVPFVKADATKFSETGYMGGDVEDLIRDLVQRANGDISRAQHGIVYVDEIDKIASRENGTRDVSGRGVQINLLKLMEDAEVTVASPTGSAGGGAGASGAPGNGTQPTTIQTGQILFIVSGAFAGLSRQISQRLGQGHDGDWNAALLDQARTQDFIQFGFEPEFIGRLPVRVACQPLSADDLYRVMRESESSLLRQYERAFAAYDIRVRFRADGLRAIAKLAASEQTGARGLMTVCERVLRHFKFELPSTSIRELLVDRALVENPLVRLEQVLGQQTLSPLALGKKNFSTNNLRTTAKKGLSKTE